MNELKAIGKKDMMFILKDRMKEFKKGVILKVNRKVVNRFKKLIKRHGGLLDKKALRKLNAGVIEFEYGTKIKKEGDKWFLRTPHNKYICVEDNTFNILYEGEKKDLKNLNSEMIKMMLLGDVIREDDAIKYEWKERGDSKVHIQPTKEYTKKYKSKKKAEMKLEKRVKKYKKRIHTIWTLMKRKAKKGESGWGF